MLGLKQFFRRLSQKGRKRENPKTHVALVLQSQADLLPGAGIPQPLVSIAIDAAKSCLHIFENEYPTDDRPRKALEATEKWLSEPTRENRQLEAIGG